MVSRYLKRNLAGDLAAGLTLAAIAIPEQMATARLGGFPPAAGFIAFVAGSVGFAAFGANRLLSAGADSTITPIFTSGLVAVAAAGSADYRVVAAALALFVGVILSSGGLFRLGWIADLLSVPVMTGFLAGIAVHIIASQLPALLGVPDPGGSPLHRALGIAKNLDHTNLLSLALGLMVFAVTFGLEWINPRIPGALLGFVAATAAVYFFNLEHHGVATLGAVPPELLHFQLPAFKFEDLFQITPLAFIVALVVMVQTAATTRSFASDSAASPNVNRDFMGLGAANLLAGLFGTFPVNASPPRTAIVAETGGHTQVAGLTAAALVLGLAAFGTKVLDHVPHAALAGILLFIALRIVRIHEFMGTFRQTLGEFILILVTMISIIVLPTETGVAIGIVLSLLHGMWTTTHVRPIVYEKVPGTSIWWPASAILRGETIPGVLVFAFQAPISFLNAFAFKDGVQALVKKMREPIYLIVLEASSIVEIDYTAAQSLREVIRYCQGLGMTVALTRLESVRAQQAFVRFGLMDLIHEDHCFHSVDEATQALAKK